jgi:SHAQKYF class myb-like DNA-binding protein
MLLITLGSCITIQIENLTMIFMQYTNKINYSSYFSYKKDNDHSFYDNNIYGHILWTNWHPPHILSEFNLKDHASESVVLLCVLTFHFLCHAEATPKRILQLMGVKGVSISHIKSHLQVLYGIYNFNCLCITILDIIKCIFSASYMRYAC